MIGLELMVSLVCQSHQNEGVGRDATSRSQADFGQEGFTGNAKEVLLERCLSDNKQQTLL